MIELHAISIIVGGLVGTLGALAATLYLNMPKKRGPKAK